MTHDGNFQHDAQAPMVWNTIESTWNSLTPNLQSDDDGKRPDSSGGGLSLGYVGGGLVPEVDDPQGATTDPDTIDAINTSPIVTPVQHWKDRERQRRTNNDGNGLNLGRIVGWLLVALGVLAVVMEG